LILRSRRVISASPDNPCTHCAEWQGTRDASSLIRVDQ
jgi:hypothetical protein